MQKKLIALAIAGLASTAAFAQTNVTIYGTADATFDVVNSSSGTKYGVPLAAYDNIGTYNRVSTNSSFLGFKGSEALGNGLTAVFQFESGVAFDQSGGFGATRDSYVGVAGGFGTVVLGRLTGPTRALGSAVDVFAGATGIGANSGVLGKLGGALVGGNGVNSDIPVFNECGRSATCSSVFDTRWNNAIAYVSPNFSGFSGTFAYVADENKTAKWANNTAAKRNTQGYDLGVNYKNGPILVGLTYNWATLGTNDLYIADNASELRLAGMYDFGMASIRGLYAKTKAGLNGAGMPDLKQTVWGLGGTFNIGSAGKIVGQYYTAGDVSGNNRLGFGSLKQGADLWAIGYEHSLSKRTIVKATYANLSSDRDADYDFGVNATGAQNYGGTNSGVQIGVRHSF